jgi:tight adherence protein B
VKLVVGLTVFAAIFVWARILLGRGRAGWLERRLQPHVAPHAVPPQGAVSRGGRVARSLDAAERRLAHHAGWQDFEKRLARAGIERRPVELGATITALSLVAALFALLAGSALLALFALATPTLLAVLLLGAMAQRRLRAFDEQLPDLLTALGSSLRAGHGFLQSLQAAAQDAPDPTGHELRRALAETRVGRPVDEALAGIAERVPSREFAYVLTAIAVQRQVGGSLAGLFETVNETVRSRHQFVRKVRALTATGRMSAYALIGLPIGVAGLLSLINHGYLSPMFHSHAGRLMLLFGACSMCVGALIVRRIVSFKG